MTLKCSSIVVDASIAQAAGATEHPTSRACRAFLEAIRSGSLSLVFGSELHAEWKTHRSRFARQWLTSMYAGRRVVRLQSIGDPLLRRGLVACAKHRANNDTETADAWSAAMLKDSHLIEACAAAGNASVAAHDEKVRNHFRACSLTLAVLRDVVWVNPTMESEHPLEWLAAGAPHDPARMLGT